MENFRDQKQKSAVAMKEEEILKSWQEKQIFKKTLEKNSPKGEFVFYDGPPFATGLPHYGHILPGTIKDAIPRFKTMQGYHVPRNWGWDCHGLPIENIVEKDLGLKSKKDILELGIGRFNKEARSKILRYADDWKRIIPRTGRFVDMEKDYKTMDPSYTESVWWAFKELFKKGLVYEDYKVMPFCPRCETTLSNFEVNQGYKDIVDISVYAKFQLKDEPGTFLLAWTTTPWTLPGNVALAVNRDVTYVKINIKNEESGAINSYVLAKSRLVVIKESYEVAGEFKGKKLIGKSYLPVFEYYKNAKLANRERIWKVYGAEFVTTEDGTGIVHVAPAFGGDDYELSKKEKLPIIHHVALDGKFKPEVNDFAGQYAKPKEDHQKGDVEIIKNLAHRGLLFAKEKITHSYPHCWRCETPLLNYATSSWFLKVTSLKGRLLRENQKINWVPAHVKEGRFGKWLDGARDWAISRSRFWGAPLPVWKCEKCSKVEALGSIEEIKGKAALSNQYFVMRHGEAKSNVLGIMSSDPNMYGLTRSGEEQAAKTAEDLKGQGFDLIISSPFKRTRETASIVKDTLHLPDEALVIEPLIHEVNTGVFNGKSILSYRSYSSHHDRFTQAPSDGESQLEVKKRMGDVLYSLERKYKGKKILLITHDTPAWLLFSAALGLNREETFKLHDNKKFFLANAEVRALPFAPLPHNEEYEIDLHRPYIDEVTWMCKCKGMMKRIPEIFDTWFDSGSMPFAQFHYPFQKESEKDFDPKAGLFKKTKGFPADFIAEGLDQTRGWFYTLIVLSTALFGRAPYKNVVVNGLILAEDGRKMSKSLNNYPDPMDVVNRYGADALRMYLLGSPLVRGEEVNFIEREVDEVYKKNILRLQNVIVFFEMYVNESSTFDTQRSQFSDNALDVWMRARLSETVNVVTQNLETYALDKALSPIFDFVDDLSTWYVRRSRERFKTGGKDKDAALESLRLTLLMLSKILAPFAPFLAEDMYIRAKGEKESVHLESWPHVALRMTNDESRILEEMREVRRLVSLSLEARARANIKVRQPLQTLRIKNQESKIKNNSELLNLIRDEANVKEIIFDKTIEGEVELDTSISKELKEEGNVREIMRGIQELRKKENLSPGDTVVLRIDVREEGKGFFERNKAEILRVTGIREVEYTSLPFYDEVRVADIVFKLKISR